jgi:hypothetical protein
VTWRRWLAYRTLLAEEFVVAPEREEALRARAEEDAQFHRNAEALRRVK